MAAVVDASIAGAWVLPDEINDLANSVRLRHVNDVIHVPSHWWVEVLSLLLKAERRERLDAASVDEAVDLLSVLSIEIDPLSNQARVLLFARRHELTVYDAAYLELAHRLSLPLATLDRKLAAAAVAEDVELIA